MGAGQAALQVLRGQGDGKCIHGKAQPWERAGKPPLQTLRPNGTGTGTGNGEDALLCRLLPAQGKALTVQRPKLCDGPLKPAAGHHGYGYRD